MKTPKTRGVQGVISVEDARQIRLEHLLAQTCCRHGDIERAALVHTVRNMSRSQARSVAVLAATDPCLIIRGPSKAACGMSD